MTRLRMMWGFFLFFWSVSACCVWWEVGGGYVPLHPEVVQGMDVVVAAEESHPGGLITIMAKSYEA